MWRRRHIKVVGANLVAFNDVTNKPTATIELKKATGVIDDQDPSGLAYRGARSDEDSVFPVERSFRLLFPNDGEIAFFADSDAEKSKWCVDACSLGLGWLLIICLLGWRFYVL